MHSHVHSPSTAVPHIPDFSMPSSGHIREQRSKQRLLRRITRPTRAQSPGCDDPHSCRFAGRRLPLLSRRAAMWTDCSRPCRQSLAPAGKAWPSPLMSTRTIQRDIHHAAPQSELFSSASRLGLDRRDADHGRARGRGAIRQCVADRAYLSAGAHAASSSTACWRKSSNAPGIVLYTLLDEDLRGSLARQAAASSACRACRCSGRCCSLFQSYLGARDQAARRRAAHAQRRIFQAHRRAQLHDAA